MFLCLVRESLQTVITQVILKITFFLFKFRTQIKFIKNESLCQLIVFILLKIYSREQIIYSLIMYSVAFR